MKCPRCEEGTLVKVRFKETGKRAHLCNFCESLWFEGKDIALGTAFTLSSYQRGVEREYSFDELSEKDKDHRVVRYAKF